MSIILNENIQSDSPKSLDNKFMVDGVTPYTDIAHVNSVIPLTYRSKGLTVLIVNQEYWYKDGVADTDLVLKAPTEFCEIILHKDVVIGTPVNFVHTANGTQVDVIDTDIAITRASERALFNPLKELNYRYDISPEGLLFNNDGWSNLEDLDTRIYEDLANCLNYAIGSTIVNAELVMKDTVNNKYYKLDVTSWAGGGSSGYAQVVLDRTNPPVDGTIVTLGDNGNVSCQYQYTLATNEWIVVRTGVAYPTFEDAFYSENTEQRNTVNMQIINPTDITFQAQVGGVSGNSIVSTVTPVQAGFSFNTPTLTGGTGGSGAFAYTRWLVTQTCSGKIIFSDLTEISTAPRDFKNFILVDGVFGDDTTAQPYDMLKPFKTVNKAWESAKSGDTIVLNPSPTQYLLTNSLYNFDGTKPLNYYINQGAILSASVGGSVTYNRLLIKYNNLIGGVFVVGQAITVNGCALGSIISIDTINNVLEILSGNQVMTPTFTVGNVISNGLGVTASLVSNTNSNSPENNMSIIGGGSLVLRGINFNGGYNGTFTIDVADLYITNLFYYGVATYGSVNINCNNLILNSFFYYDNATYNYGGIGLITYTNEVGGAFPRGTKISNGAGVTAYVLQDDGAGYINIYNIQGGNFSNGDTIQDGGGTITATVSTSKLTTTPIAFNLKTKSVVVNTIIFGIFPASIACTWNIGTYRKTVIENTVTHQVFFYGGIAPQFPVISNIHFDDFVLDSSTSNYAQSVFYMATGQSLNGKYFITGYYKYTGSLVIGGQTPSLILLNGNTIQYIEFNGNAQLKNSGFINEVSNYIPNYSFSQIVVRGSVNIDNSQTPVYWGLIWSGILISNSKLKMYADLIYDSPINFAILLGNYTSNLTSLEVDLIDCQIVNKNQASLLPVIGVGFVGGSAMLPPLTLPNKLPIQIKYLLAVNPPDFSNGETISNGLGATGIVNGVPDGTYLFITTVVGQFNIGDTITGGTSGASATVQEVNYWGTLRLKNAVVVGNTLVQNSIEGAWQGQPYQVYTGYANKPQLNMSNEITGTTYIVDSSINSNNF